MTSRPGYGERLEAATVLLAQHEPVVAWSSRAAGRVRVAAHVGAVDLPTEIPGRVRCLVTDGEQVLVATSPARPSSGARSCRRRCSPIR